MKLPRRISKSTAIMLMFIAWWAGWQYHNQWSITYNFLEFDVWQPYAWFWEPLILLSGVSLLGFFAVMFVKWHYELKKTREPRKENIGR